MKHPISRRHVLCGAGVALSLPWLESLAPRPSRLARAQNETAKRAVFTYFPHGTPLSWHDTTGTGSGAAWQLSPLQAAFAPLKSKLMILRMLGNFTWRSDLLNIAWDTTQERMDHCLGCVMPVGAYILPSHSRDPGGLWNCVDGDDWRTQNGEDRDNSPRNPQTIDQLVADNIGAANHLSSMQVGLFNGNGDLDQRHGNLSREISFGADGNVLNKKIDPAAVFDDIVGGQAPTDSVAADRRRALDLSLLDAVEESVNTLKPRLGVSDNERLDQFLTSTRELELRVMAVTTPTSCGDGATAPAAGMLIPGEVGYLGGGPEVTQENMWLRAQTMNDLIVMALSCDATRVVSYILDNSRSDLNYSWLSTPEGNQVNGFHGETHVFHEPRPSCGPAWETIMRWQADVIADLVGKLDAVPDGVGTLLDNSVVVVASDEHHNDHAAFDLPVMVFGSGGGVFKQDELVMFPNEISQMRQLRDFHYTLLTQYLQIDIPSYGNDMRGLPNTLMSEILA